MLNLESGYRFVYETVQDSPFRGTLHGGLDRSRSGSRQLAVCYASPVCPGWLRTTPGSTYQQAAGSQYSGRLPVIWRNESWQARIVDQGIECGYIRVDDLVELASECSDAG